MSHIWVRHVTRMNASCHHVWMRSVMHTEASCSAHINESRHTYESVRSHMWMRHPPIEIFLRPPSESCHTHVTRMSESCHTHEWVISHVWVSHVTHMSESCHTNELVMSHAWASHVTRMSESCHKYVTRISESCHTNKWVMSHTSVSQVTHMNESCHTYEWDVTRVQVSCIMRWLRLVGSIKLYVSSAKEPYTRDYILYKRPVI